LWHALDRSSKHSNIIGKCERKGTFEDIIMKGPVEDIRRKGSFEDI
jgi:hypothetical protein